MTTEEKIAELETNCKAMTEEIEKLKAELAEKDKNETVWLPKSGDDYSYIQGNGNISISLYSSISFYDLGLINMNAAFKPDTETQKHLRWYRDNVLRVQNKLMQLHELLCPDYFPDWKGTNKHKFFCIIIIITIIGNMMVGLFFVIMWFISIEKQQKRLVKFLIERSL